MALTHPYIKPTAERIIPLALRRQRFFWFFLKMRIDFFEHLLYAKGEKEERAEIDSFADQIHFGCNSAVGDITLTE